MFFYYSGNEPLDILVPGEQYAVTIQPSPRSQKTTSVDLYNYLFSDAFEHKGLFTQTTSFEPPVLPKEEPKPAAKKGKDADTKEVSDV